MEKIVKNNMMKMKENKLHRLVIKKKLDHQVIKKNYLKANQCIELQEVVYNI